MKVARIGSASFQLTLHGYELATLMAAVRWAAEGGEGELTADARAQLHAVLAAYEAELGRANQDRGQETAEPS